MKKYLILIILTLTVLTILICQIERKEVINSKQLKEEIIKEAVNKLNPKDSLFIVTTRSLGVCGNDDRYDGFTTPIEKFSEIKFILENPYFVDGSEDFKENYLINNKTIITGGALDNRFSSNTLNFTYDEVKNDKQVYDIQFTTANKDTVYVSIFDYFNSENKNIKFKMVQNNSKWNIETAE
ncbi:hypothetical protein ASG22_19860 [Chryseobacterium sp. Leaf405]|uniref:hypothetical protein n=1 Tax=Chryseobacterium sp. Leaf405 TaxID=1736367 RepID=UPI0006F854B2|nr:hypothetical protein [Chryseobacterium sp. Leaf405]KQT29581.1 hypothetical protein ASG22_19860 [Chryseobacterium sp. Leaf405]